MIILLLLCMSLQTQYSTKWLKMKRDTHWMWWVIGGYYVSSYLFVTADLINQFIVTFPPDTESIVGELLTANTLKHIYSC
jgi:hypothetical protein